MCGLARATRAVALVSALVSLAACAAWGQPDAPGDQAADQERLRQERAEHLRQMAQQQQQQPAAMRYVITMDGGGPGQMRRMGGPPDPEMVPAQVYVAGDFVYVARGYMLCQFLTDDALEMVAEADLRTEDERAGEVRPGVVMGRPDPAMVPVRVEFGENGDLLFVLRGYMFRLYYAEGLELVGEFDLRTEEERNRPPRPQMAIPRPPGGMIGPPEGPPALGPPAPPPPER